MSRELRDIFLKTELFEHYDEYSWFFWKINLKNTNYYIYYSTVYSKPIWVSHLNQEISFEEVFEHSPPEVQEKLLYHLDLWICN